MSIMIRESDTYARMEAKLEKAIAQATNRVCHLKDIMETVDLVGATHHVIARYDDNGITAFVLPDLTEFAAVKVDEMFVLIPEQTAIAFRMDGHHRAYAIISPQTIVTGLRRAHRASGQIIPVLQSYIDRLEQLEVSDVQHEALRRKEEWERELGGPFYIEEVPKELPLLTLDMCSPQEKE